MTTAAACTTAGLSQLPALGAAFEGGTFAGITTKPDGTHCAVVLLADQPDKRLTWKAALAWAKKLKAELPARPVSALLYANVRSQIEADWHWTCEEFDGSGAWGQYFGLGFQGYNHKRYEGRARAVRLIPLAP
jgi:hypothetical protein